MAKTTFVVKVHIEGAREVLQALSVMGKDAQAAIREHSKRIADKLAIKARADVAVHGGPQGVLLAQTVKAIKDRVPVIQAGGSRRLGRNRAPAYGMLFGSIFGMNGRSGWYSARKFAQDSGRQYRPHNGTDAYAFFPVVENSSAEISREWFAAVDDVVDKFGRG